jgi:hypothetical protein
MSISMKTITRSLLMAGILANSPLQAADKGVIVTNTPDVNVANVPDVIVTNDEASPIPVRSMIQHTPVLCVVATFNAPGLKEATCVTPTRTTVTPVPSGFFLAITDVIATSQLSATSTGQAIVRISSKNGAGVQFGAGVPMVLKPSETQSLHYQSPFEVLPAGRTPTASVGLNFGDVFPVEVNFTGYLVEVDDLGLQ